MGRFRAACATAVLIAAMILSSSALAAPKGKALGHDKPDRQQGSSSSKWKPKGSSLTEDNDRDGVPNTPDPVGDADNRHPSGKDKHAEGGGSGNQGHSSSEPDGNGKGPERDEGGLDKPDGPGGLDVLDQDGNNGCGNDDDFEDDNEGLCLGRQRSQARGDIDAASATQATSAEGSASVESSDQTVPAGTEEDAAPEVLGVVVSGPATGGAPAAVLGLAASGVPTDAPAGGLAFTGVDAGALVTAMLILAVLGAAALVAGRRRQV